jgi:hypothetical protein
MNLLDAFTSPEVLAYMFGMLVGWTMGYAVRRARRGRGGKPWKRQ